MLLQHEHVCHAAPPYVCSSFPDVDSQLQLDPLYDQLPAVHAPRCRVRVPSDKHEHNYRPWNSSFAGWRVRQNWIRGDSVGLVVLEDGDLLLMSAETWDQNR